VDLSPREAVPTAVGRPRKRPWLAIGVLAAVLVGAGGLVFKFLTDAIDYYCNVDEIGVKDGCDVGRGIRIQGVVEQGTLEGDNGGPTEFVITYNGASMPVVVGSRPTGLFQECIPVVVAGRVIEGDDGLLFEGDEVLVKHDEQYDAANEERVAQSEAEAAACSQRG